MEALISEAVEFKEFPKIPRFSRGIVITEKIDGTNGQILVPEDPTQPILAGSRTRWLTPEKGNDNFGFAAWVKEHEEELRKLGPGRHFGEWYGQGIQRNYGLQEKRFALFDVHRWAGGGMSTKPACCEVVPILGKWDTFDSKVVDAAVEGLRTTGSWAVPGFMKPEGVVIYHTAAKVLFKKTLEKDDKPKGAGNE